MTSDDLWDLAKVAAGLAASGAGAIWGSLRFALRPTQQRLDGLKTQQDALDQDITRVAAKVELAADDIGALRLEAYQKFAQHDQVEKLRTDMNDRFDKIALKIDQISDKLDAKLERRRGW